ncbi:uracil-DNA glycosylase [Hyphomicrobium nitrativorans NL23]|uniref:Type-4 uracil-DNA glycosylase n=1 Tax=Hyphomicrobium nitrativorans NL23 TaxID=1029756 RepID=V5SFK4_9HYPH|nr:UdgX family uracil-DNA binding protein [Hyphomicrobium nitrativorans]AHB48749.1 uracil-DNA glycosylase [Hyphomicrobium nitrativorans NL23]
MGVTPVTLGEGADLDGFRRAVRRLIAEARPPDAVVWQTDGTPSLFDGNRGEAGADAPPISLPRAAADLIRLVVCHRDPERYALLYACVWRLLHGEGALLDIASDPLVARLALMEKSVRRDLHKMHAFLRFRRVTDDEDERYVAWFEPEHDILEETADFFVDRFRRMTWSILTPTGSLHWDRETLTVGPPGEKSALPATGAVEAGWSTYYASTFNPARANPSAMLREMPKKYWANMPETNLIPDLLRAAGSRVETLMSNAPAPSRKKDPAKAVARMREDHVRTLADLNAVIAAAEPFVTGGTRAVLGEGPLKPSLAFVGEQPGDQEDVQGRPFVGPAGQILARAMAEAGIDRDACYLTNAVKHFKFEPRGKRRLHKSPTAGEVRHYRWWLDKELDLVAPKLIVALGATAVQALTGKALPIIKTRGPFDFNGRAGFVTVHPSYLLRVPDEAAKREAYAAFVEDLAAAAALARNPTARSA